MILAIYRKIKSEYVIINYNNSLIGAPYSPPVMVNIGNLMAIKRSTLMPMRRLLETIIMTKWR